MITQKTSINMNWCFTEHIWTVSFPENDASMLSQAQVYAGVYG
tara:strand:+ start:425 stop:553 length:129 start_codon:yes stop_codon:yes gene_type:complete